MEDRGIKPDLNVYNSLLDAHCRDNNVAMVTDILNNMKQDNIETDTITYNLLLTSLSSILSFFLIFKCLENMRIGNR
jgi:pentatricopeptide repeat protein